VSIGAAQEHGKVPKKRTELETADVTGTAHFIRGPVKTRENILVLYQKKEEKSNGCTFWKRRRPSASAKQHKPAPISPNCF
jgi:hypothetical protein